MDEQLALAEQKARAIEPMAPMEMIQIAFQKALESGGPDALAVADRILEQMQKQRDYEDRDRFNASLLRIQKQLKRIPKRGWNKSTDSTFALPEDVDAEIQGRMQAEGMSLSFEPEANPQPNMVTIIGILSQGAYSRRYPLPMPCDGQGAKGGGVMTRTHATGSAITYAKRYLKNMIFDLGFKEKDDDGNKAAGRKAGRLSEPENLQHLGYISQAGNMEDLAKVYRAAQTAADEIGDTVSTLEFANAKRERVISLRKEGKA